MSGLPPPHDPRWQRARIAGSDDEVRFLPMAPPHAPVPSAALDWFRADGEIVMLDDGYPARRSRDGSVDVHPLHGRYLLADFLDRFDRDPSDELRLAILRIARAVVGRAEPQGRALQMAYEGRTASGLIGGRRHISGLPQAYYASLLARVARTLDPGFATDADRFFVPLVTPVRSGGALYEGTPGPSLAMVPMRPRDWILNGWLSMLVAVCEYADARNSSEARALVRANVETLERVLPAFDAPAQLLSRYMLPGMLQLRLQFTPPSRHIEMRGVRVEIPGEPEPIPIPLRQASEWFPRIIVSDADAADDGAIVPRGSTVRMVALLSRAPFPEPNRLMLEVQTPDPVHVALDAYIGSYDPLRSSTAERQWVRVADGAARAGAHTLTLPLAYEPIDLFSYPTNFIRQYFGRRQNTYHGTHVVRLRALAVWTGSQELRSWADRWTGYVARWPTFPAYAGFGCWTPEGQV